MPNSISKRPTADQSMAPEVQLPLKLTLEEQTPWARWLLLGILALVACGGLTYWINAGNPKITASALADLTPHPSPPNALQPNEAGYAAKVELYPPDPVPPDTTMMITATLLLHGEPVQGAKVHFSISSFRGVVRDVDGGITGADGKTVTEYNIRRTFGQSQIRVAAAFYINDKVVIRADNRFVTGR